MISLKKMTLYLVMTVFLLEIYAIFILKKTRVPFTYRYIVPCLVEIGPVVLQKRIFKDCQCMFTISL